MARGDRGLRAFWLHQGAEYLFGFVLVAQGLQSPTPTWPAIAGALLIGNAAVVEGPLAAFRAVPRALHRWLDVVVMVAIVALAAVPALDIDNTTRGLMVGVSAVFAVVWWNTRFQAPAPDPRSSGQRRDDAAGRAGRVVGQVVREARRRREG